MEFDDVLANIGGFGLFQWTLVLFTCTTSFLNTGYIWVNFLLGHMDHFCKVPELQDLPHTLQRSIAIPMESSSGGSLASYSQCTVFNLNYSIYSHEDLLNWNRTAMLQSGPPQVPCNAWVYDHSVFTRTVTSQFDLVCDKLWLNDLVSSVTAAGSLVGCLVSGTLADRYGRRWVMVGLLVAVTICCVSLSLVGNIYLFLVFRFAQGFALVPLFGVPLTIMLEFVETKHRSRVGMGFFVCNSIGYMSVSLVAYLARDYVHFISVYSVALGTTAILSIFLPESPRWLLQQDRRAETVSVLSRIARFNRRKIPDDFHLDDIVVPGDGTKSHKGSPLELVRTPRLRRRSLVLFYCWFVVCLIFYALSLNAGNLSGDLFLNNFLYGAVEMPANLLVMWAMDIKRVGRRRAQVISFMLAGMSSLATIPALLTGSHPVVVTTLCMIGKAGSTAAFNLLYIYTAELYPTQLRLVGVETCGVFARFSGIMASYAGNSLRLVWVALPALLFGVTGTLASLLSLLLPETLNKPLPATVAEVEANDKGVHETGVPLVRNGRKNSTTEEDTLCDTVKATDISV